MIDNFGYVKELGYMRNVCTNLMVENSPALRASTRITQAKLAFKLGVSKQTIVAIENEKTSLKWSLYLAMVCVSKQSLESDKSPSHLGIFFSLLFCN